LFTLAIPPATTSTQNDSIAALLRSHCASNAPPAAAMPQLQQTLINNKETLQ